ncbi:uncharacterized protein TRIADDRAFT_55783 [Trichoplax adhaerens]|uniref:PH domain-containing protein n=1 Tax=Trichoplax adhaerens TaxID=10228 RepID=B3RVU9_TRIAD|nr:hypothetical protein TRIADDRAFT_55783 [Trichoplax adhaerens]EDV26060.1 hypothetical protein TRIADDRAFT_55783 [Trichoplax adhaerens]|eukprot:XP_002112093.1 hypothetical protein TRIADDRAFT_55783 [Trichoplax adhaerens]
MDEFTQKLLERTKARRENLARKVKDLEEIRSGNGRRKRPLREDDVNDNRERNFSGVRLDTAKRRCINTRERVDRFNKVGNKQTVKRDPIVSDNDLNTNGTNDESSSQEKENVTQSIRARKAMLFQQQKQQQEEIERRRNKKQAELASRLERKKVMQGSSGITQNESQLTTDDTQQSKDMEVDDSNLDNCAKSEDETTQIPARDEKHEVVTVKTPQEEVKRQVVQPTVRPTVDAADSLRVEEDDNTSSVSESEEKSSPPSRAKTMEKRISSRNVINNIVQPTSSENKSTITKTTPVGNENSPEIVDEDQPRRKLPRHPPVPPKRSNNNHSEHNTPHTYRNNATNAPSEKRRSSNTTPQQRRSSHDNQKNLPPIAPKRKSELEPVSRSQERLNLPTPDISNRASTGIFCGNFMQQKLNKMAGESLKEFSEKKGDGHQEDIRIILEEAATQQAIQFQASNALGICHPGSIEEAEAEKALLLAATRHQACLDQVQRLRGDTNLTMSDSVLHNQSEFRPVNTDLSLSDNIVHSFMVLVRDNQLTTLSSNLYSTRDGLQKEMAFANEINLKNVNRNVSLRVEIYCLRQNVTENVNNSGNTSGNKLTTPKVKKQNLFPKPSPKTPKKFMNMLTGRSQAKGSTSHSLSNTPKTANIPQHTNLKKTRFELIAVAKIDRHTLRNDTYELEQIVKPSPLSSYIHVTTKCNPMSVIEHRGFLNVHDDIGGYNVETWRRRWCKITPYAINLWNYPEDEEKGQTPITKLDLRYCVTESVHVLPREECFRRHTFRLDMHYLRPVNKSGQVKVQYLLSADCKEERTEWTSAINQLLTDIQGWQLGRIPSNRKEPSYCDV